MRIVVESPIEASPRVQQVRGMFDLPAEKSSRVTWDVDLPLDREPWSIGLIVGPSGCGKTTLAKRLFADADYHGPHGGATDDRLRHGSVVDAFPLTMGIQDIVTLLSAVGFASPPAWLRPFAVLSTGQQFRVRLALALAMAQDRCVVFDEYTSVVDRTVAQVGSAAVAKSVRQRGQRFVAVTCHDDVEAWLNPDWVYYPAENRLTRRLLRRRPAIELDIVRVKTSAWPLFAPHHYLNTSLAHSATCFLARWRDRPVAFSAWLPFYGKGPRARREHRTVTLPDYQGVGVGNALSDFVAALWTGLGYRVLSSTTHPAMIQARVRSRNWRMHRAPSFASGRAGKLRHATTRLTAGFAYIGPALPPVAARALMEDAS
jgi:energy-coupling factor transporter ATP-binding protein EcfA2